ncbi:MAG: hypothetical protein J5509_04890 [Lachnospiraceae bacterium]|nr:hypothetical protein [Lachnospiraceae bacterium]
MFDLSYFGAASFIMDGAALFILVGMMICTTLYRRRGKPADKMFFALLVTDIIAAVFNSILYIIIGFGIPIESVLCLITFLMIFLAIDAFSILFCLYQMYRMEWEKEKVNRTILALCIPELMLVVI